MAKITAITVYHNRERFVRESVGSLVSQSCRDLEIVLVDDGSSDGTLEELRRFEPDPRVEVVSGPNRGFTAAIRSAIEKHATGEFVAVHGSGDWSHPSRIEKQARLMESRPTYAGVGCWVENVDEKGNRQVWHTRARPLDFHDLSNRNWFSHGEVMFRRSAYDACGGYRPAFRYSQDYDLWLRMAGQGRMGFVPEVLYRRHVRSDGVELNPRKKAAQIYMLASAVANARLRRRCGVDAVEVFGEPGVGMALGLGAQSRRCLMLAAVACGRDDNAARLMCELAGMNRGGGAARILAAALRIGAVNAIARKFVEHRRAARRKRDHG